jgi:type IV secretion system protein VirB2
MKSINQTSSASAVNNAWRNVAVILALTAVCSISFAQGFGSTDTKGIADAILGWITPMSVAIVTIAFIFAGYQIAFGGKRFNDVMPVVIGAIIIGAAGQFAKLLIPN